MKLKNKNLYRNLPLTRTRKIEHIDEYYPKVLPGITKTISEITRLCFENNISRRKQKKMIHRKLKDEFSFKELQEI